MEHFMNCPEAVRSLHYDTGSESWYVSIKSEFHLIGSDDFRAALSLLPFIEIPVEEFKEKVQTFLFSHPGAHFPFDAFIRAGFAHATPHWIHCTVQWLAELQEFIDEDFSEQLELIVSKTKNYSQKDRHLARKLALYYDAKK